MRISDENAKKNNYSPPTPTSQLRRVLSLFVRYHTTPTAANVDNELNKNEIKIKFNMKLSIIVYFIA